MSEWELREALEEEGCPVCRMNKEAVERFWRWFLLENCHTWPMIDRLINGGFCSVHAVQAEDCIGKLLSTPLSYVVRQRKLNLEAMLPVLKKKRFYWQRHFSYVDRLPRKLLDSLFEHQKCPVCETIELSEKYALSMLQKKYQRTLNFSTSPMASAGATLLWHWRPWIGRRVSYWYKTTSDA